MLLQSNSETVINHKGKEIPKDIYIYIYIYIPRKKKIINTVSINTMV